MIILVASEMLVSLSTLTTAGRIRCDESVISAREPSWGNDVKKNMKDVFNLLHSPRAPNMFIDLHYFSTCVRGQTVCTVGDHFWGKDT